MKFYTSIAPYYDRIFPFKPVQKEFVLSLVDNPKNKTLLDVGSGTGGLVSALADDFTKLTGIDPDKEMLALSKRLDNVDYMPLGMLDLGHFKPLSFDVISCFGNTLVHLGNENEVLNFLTEAKSILKKGGLLLIQIINYDRILDQNLKGLPTIENEEIKFERMYHYEDNPVKLDFITRLTIKSTNQIIENSVPLLTLRPDILKHLTLQAGFTEINYYGNFKKDSFTADSQPFIISAK